MSKPSRDSSECLVLSLVGIVETRGVNKHKATVRPHLVIFRKLDSGDTDMARARFEAVIHLHDLAPAVSVDALV
jgi:hypothetical protein